MAFCRKSFLLVLLGFIFVPSSQAEPPTNTSYPIAIIIDDVGHSLSLGKRAVELPGEVTYSILPHTPHGRRLANQAHASGKEIMLHMPMSAMYNRHSEPSVLHPFMTVQQFQQTLEDALADIPHIQGINNHMGSELTQLEQPMRWLMSGLQCYKLYFIDSRTSPRSVAGDIAQSQQIPSLERDIFLDNEQDWESLDTMFDALLEQAKSRGYALAIGHPYQITLDYLEYKIPKLETQGFKLVPASELVNLVRLQSNQHTPPQYTLDLIAQKQSEDQQPTL